MRLPFTEASYKPRDVINNRAFWTFFVTVKGFMKIGTRPSTESAAIPDEIHFAFQSDLFNKEVAKPAEASFVAFPS